MKGKIMKKRTCSICGIAAILHRDRGCWEFSDNSFDAAILFKKRVKATDKISRPSWNIVESAFRAGYVMVNRKWIEYDGKGIHRAPLEKEEDQEKEEDHG